MVIVRSPHAHARIAKLELSRAASAPGVLGAFSGEDLARDGLGTPEVTIKRHRPDGSPMFWCPHPGLARNRVRFVGDALAVVVAESLMQARDAAERVEVEYDPLAAVSAVERASARGAPAVWEECPDNVCNVYELGDAAAVEAAFAGAARVVKGRYAVSRVHAQYMEPRGALGEFDPESKRFTLHLDVQYPHLVRGLLARWVLRVPPEQIRVIARDVGGAFGAKGWAYIEPRLVLWLARKLGRPVKWICERSETPLADEHGRDCVSDAELALDARGRFLALRVRTMNNLGAYVSTNRNLLPSFVNLGSLVGMYDFAAAHVRVTGVFSHTSPQSSRPMPTSAGSVRPSERSSCGVALSTTSITLLTASPEKHSAAHSSRRARERR